MQSCSVTPHSPFKTPNHLCVTQELPEVYVEHVAGRAQHDVVVVTVTNA